MGKIITQRPKQDYIYEIDWHKLANVAFGTLGFLVVAVIGIALTFHIARWVVRKPAPPPKVITRVVYQSALSAAQKSYIKDCEGAITDIHGNNVGGTPDVHSDKWSCTYPN